MSDLSLSELLAVRVVSASLLEEDSWKAPAIISVLSSRQLREYAYLSVADALQYVPGFYGVNDYVNFNVGVRGVNGGMGAQSSVIKTMISGRDARYRPTAGSFLGPELIPTYAIKQVEIIRGPVSALYGADAFLGVLNVIPNTAEDMGPGHARLGLRTLSDWGRWGVQADGAAWGTVLGIDGVVCATLRQIDRGDLYLPQSSPRYDALHDGLGYTHVDKDPELAASSFAQLSKKWEHGEARVDANVQLFRRGANFNYESSPLGRGTASLYNFGTTLRLQHVFFDKLRVNGFVAYDQGSPTDWDRLKDRSGRFASFRYLARTLDYRGTEERLEVTYADQIPGIDMPFSVTVGGDHVWTDAALPAVTGIREAPLPPTPLGPPSSILTQHNFGGVVQVRAEPVSWLDLIAGARYESHSDYGDQFSFRAGAAYTSETIAAKLLYGRAFKAPSVSLLYARPVIGGGPEANPDLRPQYAETGEAHFSWKPLPWLVGGVTGYISKITDFATIDTESFTPRAQNNAEILSAGGELEVTAEHSSGVGGFLGLSGVWAEETQISATLTKSTAPTSLFPTLSIMGGVQYRIPSWHVRFLVMDRYVSDRRADSSNFVFGNQPYSLAGYNILSAGVFSEGLRILDERESVFGVKGDNVLDARYADPGFLGIDLPGARWSLMFSAEQTF